ncbi:MAG: HTTM domain-containing protein, partial [Chloroflexota bacterium]
TIPFWLSWRRSRPFAYLVVIGFHAMTGLLFNIGVFPWIMIAVTLVFFDWKIEPQPRNTKATPKVHSPRIPHPPRLLYFLLAVFFLFQLILPLRHWFISGNVSWTEQGTRFAWRVMLVEKTGSATFYVQDKESGREWLVFPSDYLTTFQEKQMSFQPDMIMAFAQFIAEQYEMPVAVRAEVYVSWNGRSSQLLLDPTVDLLQAAKPPLLFRDS